MHPTRYFRRSFHLLLMAALMSFAGACASLRGEQEGGIRVHVRNDLVPSMTLAIYGVVDGGTPVRLGSIIGGGEQTFTFRPSIRTGMYRLAADRPGPGGTLFSEPLPLPADGVDEVRWELATNNIILP